MKYLLTLRFSALVPPDILDYPTSTDMVVREGSNVNLRCVARGSPEPTITWRRETGEMIRLGKNEEGKLNAFGYFLYWLQISFASYGFYI